MRRRSEPREIRSLRARLVLPLTLVAGVVAVGTAGYVWLWWRAGGTLLDAVYMTVITITTIGYGEVKPLDSTGRVFTMVIAITGVGSLFYTAGAVMEYLVAVRLADPGGHRKMERRIEGLSGHIIVAGLGRVGRQAAQELQAARADFVVVDPGEAAQRQCQERGYLHVSGDATEDEVLDQAGVTRARGLIVTTANDATNMYIVLSARVRNPGLAIVCRAVDDTAVPKLMRAGANRAISPYAIGGHRLAHLLLSPTVVDFFETALRRGQEALNIEGVAVTAGSPAAGKTLAALDIRQASGATVLAVLRDGNPVVTPAGDFALRAGDQLLALGTAEQLTRLERLLLGAG
jgi:voltage-gated potassium channel